MRKVYPVKVCPQCSTEFTHTDNRQVFCSMLCRCEAYKGSGNPKYKGENKVKSELTPTKQINGIRKPVSRWIVEDYIGRELFPEEKVAIIDGNVLNLDITNLQLLTTRPVQMREGVPSPVVGKKRIVNKPIPVRSCKLCGNIFQTSKATQEFCGIDCKYEFRSTGYVNYQGYKRIHKDGEYRLEHRYVMEQHLGRKLTSKETIHHIDRNKLNNDISNLMLFANHSLHLKHEKEEFQSPVHKQCNACKEIKPRAEFSPNANCKRSPYVDTHAASCKKCLNAKRQAERDALKTLKNLGGLFG